jgi:hypothetical protein
VVEALEHHLTFYAGAGKTGFVFTAPHGGNLDVNTFRNRYWLPAVAAAGLAPLRVHDLPTPLRRWPSPPGPTSEWFSRCSATPRPP